MQKGDTITIDGTDWRLDRYYSPDVWTLLQDGDHEGGSLRAPYGLRRLMVAALPDGVTTGLQRTRALQHHDYGAHYDVGCANVWSSQRWRVSGEADDWTPVVRITATRQRAVLRVLASINRPGEWVCGVKLADHAGWRFGGRIYELRRQGYTIETKVCEHVRHRTLVRAYRLPGLAI